MESHGKYKLWILEMAFTARTVEKLYVRNGLIAWKSFISSQFYSMKKLLSYAIFGLLILP